MIRPRSARCLLRVGAVASVVAVLIHGSTLSAKEPFATTVGPGSSIDLLKAWPEIAQAPRADLATMEFLIRPDADAIGRPRSFVMTLSNSAGRDTAGLSLTIHGGVIRAHVFGTLLESGSKLSPDHWVHVALTVNTNTINKQATLWINGEQVSEELVLEPWPQSFEVAQMLSDKWNQGRVFSGQIGDVRISRTIRYDTAFVAPTSLARDEMCVLHFSGNKVPLQ